MTGDEKSFLDIVSDKPDMRIWEFFLINRELDFSPSDAIEMTGIARSAFYKPWKTFLEQEWVVLSRKTGKTKLYRLNLQHEIVKAFTVFFDDLLRTKLRTMQAPVQSETTKLEQTVPAITFSKQSQLILPYAMGSA